MTIFIIKLYIVHKKKTKHSLHFDFHSVNPASVSHCKSWMWKSERCEERGTQADSDCWILLQYNAATCRLFYGILENSNHSHYIVTCILFYQQTKRSSGVYRENKDWRGAFVPFCIVIPITIITIITDVIENDFD